MPGRVAGVGPHNPCLGVGIHTDGAKIAPFYYYDEN